MTGFSHQRGTLLITNSNANHKKIILHPFSLLCHPARLELFRARLDFFRGLDPDRDRADHRPRLEQPGRAVDRLEVFSLGVPARHSKSPVE
jgi:hypothetical protein